MKINHQRNRLQTALFFVRWQFWPVLISLPGHFAFVMRGLNDSKVGTWNRLILVLKMLRVHLVVTCGHNPMELIHIVEEIITLPDHTDGAVVECGAFLGGSTAKLSHAAALVNRRLIVCDSFQGLPEVSVADEIEGKEDFEAGDFAGRLDQVRDTVSRYGNVTVVEFVPGWYQDTLPQLSGTRVACLFLDVDLQESIRTCLTFLWRSLSRECKVFVHDVDRASVVEPFRNEDWWQSHIGSGGVPKFVGAEKGLSWQKPLLGYAVKN